MSFQHFPHPFKGKEFDFAVKVKCQSSGRHFNLVDLPSKILHVKINLSESLLEFGEEEFKVFFLYYIWACPPSWSMVKAPHEI